MMLWNSLLPTFGTHPADKLVALLVHFLSAVHWHCHLHTALLADELAHFNDLPFLLLASLS